MAEKYLDEDFKGWLQALMDEHHVPGMSVAVVHDGEIEAAGYGVRLLPDEPATADTLYSMASTTKAFVSAVVGLLIEEFKQKESNGNTNGAEPKLDWATPVKPFLGDDFVTTSAYVTSNTSFEDMLSHRTGIPGHDYLMGPFLESPAGTSRVLRELEVSHPFRAQCQYNNLVYGAAGHAIEKITGQTWPDVVRERIFKPLEMHNTYDGVEEASKVLAKDESGSLQFARGYHWVDESKNDTKDTTPTDKKTGYYIADPGCNIVPLNAAGANISSVLDYAKWIKALLQASVDPASEDKDRKTLSDKDNPQKQIISNNIWKEVTTPRTFWLPVVSPNPEIIPLQPNAHTVPMLYALGWLSDTMMFPGEVLIRHAGGLPSFGADVSLLPNLNFGVTAAGNTAGTSNKICDFIVKELAGRRLGITKEERRRRIKQDSEQKPDLNPEETADLKHDGQPEQKLGGNAKEAKKPHYNASSPNFAHDNLKLSAIPIDTNHDQTQVDTSSVSTFYLADETVSLPQTFHHPGYGSFKVSIAPAALALSHPAPTHTGASIIRNHPGLTKRERTANDVEQPHTLHLKPIGVRSLQVEMVLHPSAVIESDGDNDGKIIYDMELIMRHGLPDESQGDIPDPFSSLPPGHGREDDEKYPYRKVRVWNSDAIKRNGAVLVIRKRDGGNDKGYTVVEMGLALARIEEPKTLQNGVLDSEWRKRMVWFAPERPQTLYNAHQQRSNLRM